ncbi:MAG: lysogenization regulator HflD [Gammaproteobacteria bacterium]|nr:MAG: lysogenization regulator HflD [Gammaproteobacteria bacterium]
MNPSLRDRTLALAGLFQAARLTQQLAREGRTDGDALAASVHSLFMIDAATTAEVFGGTRGVALGLRLLRDKLAGRTEPGDMEIARYVVALLQLERMLERRVEAQDAIRRGLEAAESQTKSLEPDGGEPLATTMVEKVAELYTQTISPLGPRVMVNGEQGYLANSLIAAKVRCALFAGIRAAFLWRQLGGRRWQLLFQRKQIANEAGAILTAAPA